MLNWKLRRGIEKRRMSDRRKSGMSCPPLRPSRLSSCYSLPNYNLILGWRHLAIHTRAYQMTSTAVWPCITCLEEQQGSLTFNNTKGMGVLMTHVMRIIMAYIQTLRQFISLWLQVILNREKCERWVDSTLSLLFFHYSSRNMTTTTYPDTSDEYNSQWPNTLPLLASREFSYSFTICCVFLLGKDFQNHGRDGEV